MADKDRRTSLEQRMKKLRNRIDKMMYDEYTRTRGLQPQTPAPAETLPEKTAAAPLTPESTRSGGASPNRYSHTSAEDTGPGIGTTLGNMTNPANLTRGIESMWWLWATAAFALTYRASKVYNDKNDPARQRLKQIKRVAEERAKVTEAPMLMDQSSLEDLQPAATKPKVRKLTSVGSRTPPQAPRATTAQAVNSGNSRFLQESDLRELGRKAMTPELAAKAQAAGLSVDPKDPYAALLNQ
jgi:hypothetical protein